MPEQTWMPGPRRTCRLTAVAACIALLSALAAGQTTRPASDDALDPAHTAAARKLIDGGVEYLLTRQDAEGAWDLGGGTARPAATALVLKAVLQHPEYDADSPPVRRGFDVLLRYRQEDGGIYQPGEGLATYTTAVAVMAMTAADRPRLREPIREAVGHLRGLVIESGSRTPGGQVVGEDHPMRGGVSYGSRHGRPDLSNVGMWMETMHQAGVPGDDPDMQKVLGFVTRTQNFTETNERPWALVGPNDGGFIYAPAVRDDLASGESKAGPAPAGGLRSYGSMTYTGFKSMLYADVERSDRRVRAAFDWIREHWRLDSNPNMPHARSRQGLYYYYLVFARALRRWGEPVITDVEGERHNWRHELIDTLAERVRPDGSWVNEADRWFESNPVLVTSYAVLALQETLNP